MIEFLVAGLLTWILVYSIIQLLVVGKLVQAFQRRLTEPQQSSLPKAAIVLVVRGADPFLESNIRSLLQQDYPEYTLFVVVDSIDDPAWQILDGLCRDMGERVRVSLLKAPLTTCSLKCCAMAQALDELDSSFEVVAFADGDTHTHRTWLRELVWPLLSDAGIGISTGCRWYLPSDGGLGSMTRYFWNVGSVAQIWLNGFAWPGSMAMRLSVLKDSGLIAALRKSLFDGPTVVHQIRRIGLRVRFVPSVMIVNREKISLSDFSAWVERQAVVGRFWGGNWYILFLHRLTIAVSFFAPPLAMVIGFMASDRMILYGAFLVAGIYWCATAIVALALELSVRRVLALDRSDVEWYSWPKALTSVPGLLLAHLVSLRATVRAAQRKTVTWRGIEYEFHGNSEVRMRSYRPFRQSTGTNTEASVL